MGGPDPEQARATIETWLDRQGYPLEYETARQFRAAGFRVQQGIYYDPATAPGDRPMAEPGGKPREIDILAGLRSEPDGVTLNLVAECKHVQAGWVVLTTTAHVWTPEQSLCASERARGALSGRADRIEFLSLPPRYGFGVAQVTTKNDSRDLAYEAISQAVGAAQYMTATYFQWLAVTHPVVVARGPLFQLGFSDDGSRLLEPVLWQRLVWWGMGGSPMLVDIVSADHLETYARRAYKGLQEIGDVLGRVG